jgi:hypothetical protein
VLADITRRRRYTTTRNKSAMRVVTPPKFQWLDRATLSRSHEPVVGEVASLDVSGCRPPLLQFRLSG